MAYPAPHELDRRAAIRRGARPAMAAVPTFDPALVYLYGWAGGDGRAGLWPRDDVAWRAGDTLCVRSAGHAHRYLDYCDAMEILLQPPRRDPSAA